MLIVIVLLAAIVNWCNATSYGRSRALSYISPVNSVQINTKNGLVPESGHEKFSVSIEIPSTRRYHNLQRKWWAVSDPNNYQRLKDLKSLSDQTENLYHFLATNASTLEQPEMSQQYRFVLEPTDQNNHDIPVYTTDEDGQIILHPDFANSTAQTKSFQGNAYRRVPEYRVADGSVKYRFKPVGWARFTIHRQGKFPKVQGAWRVDDSTLGVRPAIYHIDGFESFQTTLNKDELNLMRGIKSESIVWRDVDMSEDQDEESMVSIPDDEYQFLNKRASTGGSGSNDDTGDSGFSSGVNLANTIGDTEGCPTHREIALVGVAADCNFVGEFNNTGEAREHIINMVNTASQQYEKSFNITLGLSSIFMVNDTNCPAQPDDSPVTWNYACGGTSDTMGDRLSRFSEWRGQGNRTNDGCATWSLMTSCAQGSVVGLSWLGMLCGSTASRSGNDTFVAGTNVISKTSLDWRVFAHELGHTFGAVHDCTDETCSQGLADKSQCCPLSKDSCNAGGKYIMNPASTDSQDGFSKCSQGNICQAMNRNSVNSTCLTSNTGVHLVTKNECGNGIVEEGEDCDCGGEEGCKGNTCCDPKTCKFTSGSVCDDSNEDCCDNCQYASSDKVCRASVGPCDPEEKCTGKSSECPPNKMHDNGESCTDPSNPDLKGLVCISGHCSSRDLQCVTLLQNTTLQVDGRNVNASNACSDDTSCQLSCMDNSMGSVCFTANQNFMDGTPCQGKGQCVRGRCVNGSHTNPFSGNGNGFLSPSWLERHKDIVIGVCAGIGGLILIAILWGFIRRCLVTRGVLKAKPPVVRRPPPPPPPPPQMNPNPFATDASNYYPRPPPPTYEMSSMNRSTMNRY